MITQAPKRCAACGKPLPVGSHGCRLYCQEVCDHRRRPAPAIYRFVCPDGRCYVGHTSDHRIRNQRGLGRSNLWIAEALEQYPPKMWTFEVLENLHVGCSKQTLRHAEQQHIERLRSWIPEHGSRSALAQPQKRSGIGWRQAMSHEPRLAIDDEGLVETTPAEQERLAHLKAQMAHLRACMSRNVADARKKWSSGNGWTADGRGCTVCCRRGVREAVSLGSTMNQTEMDELIARKEIAMRKQFNFQDKAAFAKLDENFMISADGETATVIGSMKIEIIRAADDGGARFQGFTAMKTRHLAVARATAA